MNRLVIIGNGFDLAHGLPTSYGHFIDDFWANIKDNYKKKEYESFIYVEKKSYLFENIMMVGFESLKKYCENCNRMNSIYRFNTTNFELKEGSNVIFKFENNFFKLINIKNTENWVDIENEYYKELKEIVNRPKSIEENKTAIIKLNTEFDQVKKLLEDYLIRVQEKFEYKSENNTIKFYDYFNPDVRYSLNINEYLKEFRNEDHIEIRSFIASIINRYETNTTANFSKNYFLNFNYTNTIDFYTKRFQGSNFIELKQIQIHGRLKDKENLVNFGFGDEMDNHYKEIENINDNEYLKNFKSFQYLQNSNYKNLLDYIDSEKFQVYIMGHSCGLSDRTLLNTIFEHGNCRSIKIFYYKKDDGTDNYTEIVQNISRHFNKKALMREKIVNKSLCIPLPINLKPETLYK